MSGKWTLRVLLAIAVFGASRFVFAADPQPAADKEATPTAQPAPEQIPAPAVDKPDTDSKIKPMPQPKRPEALQGNKPAPKEVQPPVDRIKKEKQSLVQPPGLLSQSPTVAPFTRPGLG